MTGFFASANLESVREQLGLLQADIHKAAKTASKKTFTWAKREAAKGVSKAAEIPYSAARIRTKAKGKIDASGRVWFGLNAISAKYLGAKARKGTFTAPKLNEHRFKRVGKSRLPIKRVDKDIEDDSLVFIEGDFIERIEAKLVEEFLSALDKIGGRSQGASRIIIGS